MLSGFTKVFCKPELPKKAIASKIRPLPKGVSPTECFSPVNRLPSTPKANELIAESMSLYPRVREVDDREGRIQDRAISGRW